MIEAILAILITQLIKRQWITILTRKTQTINVIKVNKMIIKFNSSGKGGRGTASPSRPGGNWPSGTGKPSGGGRGNASPSKGK